MDLLSIKQRFGIIGNSPALNRALEVAARVAPTNLSVLITGESGVGKEVFSQIIHNLSTRKHENFIAVNCGAIPEGTIDSELFGHEKGAFTGAHDKRKGYFETVNGGTIFLDEIGEMPIGTQARLLRLLESGEFIKVGSSIVQKTDVRVLAATNVDLPKLIKKDRFREDLYYRLNTVPIFVPPLRERKEDIILLFRKFASDFSEKYRMQPIQLTDEAKQLLTNYRFPGNIRELKNIAEQVSVLAKDKTVSKEELAQFIPNIETTNLPAVVNTGEANTYSDREILYKMIFDMKNDLNELKRFVWDSNNGNYDTSKIDFSDVAGLEHPTTALQNSNVYTAKHIPTIESISSTNPTIILNEEPQYEEESIETNLSLADMEKTMIIKALEKHRGKRRDAALDLGISERTLYRKIKEYELE
ncbi:MAG TPA: sigma-54 dependent transcriptional regulator [Chitinophagales bacterium]|nr:sigma-54 dependent transcriptional regulator [Chitinophagales bacterium]HNM32904.1 sigma-54 dependent transcriptional regulator [Chitinophagales bacterium]